MQGHFPRELSTLFCDLFKGIPDGPSALGMTSRSPSCPARSASGISFKKFLILSSLIIPSLTAFADLSESLKSRFDSEELAIVAREGLASEIEQLAQFFKKEEKIVAKDMIIGARMVKSGPINVASQKLYLTKLLGFDVPLLEALERVQIRIKYDAWSKEKVKATRAADPGGIVTSFEGLKVKDSYKQRLVRVYSLCIDSYRNPDDRINMRKIEIGEKSKLFTKIPKERPPQSVGHDIDEMLSLDGITDPKERAFRIMINASKTVAKEQSLDDWNKACLAKCVADEMIEFVEPFKNPFTMMRSMWVHMWGEKSEVLAHRKGICIDYAAITKAFAIELGFNERVRLKHKGKHWFNQFKIDGHWYHFHPLRKYGKECTFIPY